MLIKTVVTLASGRLALIQITLRRTPKILVCAYRITKQEKQCSGTTILGTSTLGLLQRYALSLELCNRDGCQRAPVTRQYVTSQRFVNIVILRIGTQVGLLHIYLNCTRKRACRSMRGDLIDFAY